MEKPKHHLLVCSSFRVKGDPQGICHKKSGGLMPYVEEEILSRGLDARLTATGCLKQCEQGPVLVVYPEGFWYGPVDSEEAVDDILEALENGGTCEKYLLA